MIIRFDTMFTDTNEIQFFINHCSEPVGILSKFSIYIYGGGESEKEGGKSHGGSLYSFLVENCWSFVNHYKVKK